MDRGYSGDNEMVCVRKTMAESKIGNKAANKYESGENRATMTVNKFHFHLSTTSSIAIYYD